MTGLKIPLSSIVTKEFYAIPSKYLTTDDETQQSGFMLSGRNKKGDSTTTFVSAGIYGRDEITDKETQETSYIYYVDKNKFKEGDALVDPDSGKFIIGDTEVLEGVFCVNQDMLYSAGSRSWMKMRNMRLYQRKPIMGLSDMTVL